MSEPVSISPEVDQPNSPKRRKIRKGTRSCWECKRRKVKCIFSCEKEVVCLNCQRRGSKCISQDLPEEQSSEASPFNGSQHLDDRLGRVEQLLNNLSSRTSDTNSSPPDKTGTVCSWSTNSPRLGSDNSNSTYPTTVDNTPSETQVSTNAI